MKEITTCMTQVYEGDMACLSLNYPNNSLGLFMRKSSSISLKEMCFW